MMKLQLRFVVVIASMIVLAVGTDFSGFPHANAVAPDAAKPRTDAYGDPLPEGAVLRLGSFRWRGGPGITAIYHAPDGKSLITVGGGGLKRWDTQTGKVIHRIEPTEDCSSAHGWITPDCKKLVTTYYLAMGMQVITREMRVWDISTGQMIHSLGDRALAGVAFTADSKIAAFYNSIEAKNDDVNAISLWDLAAGAKIGSWDAEQNGVAHAVFSPDGKTLITGGGDKSIRFWDVPSGTETRRLNSSGDAVIGYVAISPDGKRLAAIDQKVAPPNTVPKSPPRQLPWGGLNSIRIWDLATGKEVHQLIATLDGKSYSLRGFTAAAFTPDSKSLVTAGPDQYTRIWDVQKGIETARYELQSGWGMTLSPDGKAIAAISSNNAILLADRETGKCANALVGHNGQPNAARWTADGKSIITAGRNPHLIVWDARSGKEQRRLGSNGALASSFELSRDDSTLTAVVTSGERNNIATVETWNIKTGMLQQSVPLGDGTRGGWLSPDLKVMAATTWQKPIVTLVSATTGKQLKELDTGKVPYTNAFIDGGRTLLVGVDDHTIQVWDVAKAEKTREIPALGPIRGRGLLLGVDGPNTSWFYLRPSSNEKLLTYVHGNQPLIVLYDLVASKEVLRLADLEEAAISTAISPDNSLLAWTGMKDTSIHVVDIASGRELHKLKGHTSYALGLTFSPNGKQLISCSSDGTSLVWDVSGER